MGEGTLVLPFNEHWCHYDLLNWCYSPPNPPHANHHHHLHTHVIIELEENRDSSDPYMTKLGSWKFKNVMIMQGFTLWRALKSQCVIRRTEAIKDSGVIGLIPKSLRGQSGITYNGLLLSNKTEWAIDTLDSIDELRNNYAQWKKPDKQGYILYNSIYTHFWKMQTNLEWQKAVQWLSGVGRRCE